MAICYHRLLHSTTTIEKGDNIVAVTFFTSKPPKRQQQLPSPLSLQHHYRKR
jgi:hypothetical protein